MIYVIADIHGCCEVVSVAGKTYVLTHAGVPDGATLDGLWGENDYDAYDLFCVVIALRYLLNKEDFSQLMRTLSKNNNLFICKITHITENYGLLGFMSALPTTPQKLFTGFFTPR